MDPNYGVKEFIKFVKNWRDDKERLSKVLSGDSLVDFVTDLQNKIISDILFQDEGKLVLYSGVSYTDVETMCRISNGHT